MSPKIIHDRVCTILKMFPETRGSDKRLIWKYWEVEGLVFEDAITRRKFLNSTESDQILLEKTLIQQNHPELSVVSKSSERKPL